MVFSSWRFINGRFCRSIQRRLEKFAGCQNPQERTRPCHQMPGEKWNETSVKAAAKPEEKTDGNHSAFSRKNWAGRPVTGMEKLTAVFVPCNTGVQFCRSVEDSKAHWLGTAPVALTETAVATPLSRVTWIASVASVGTV